MKRWRHAAAFFTLHTSHCTPHTRVQIVTPHLVTCTSRDFPQQAPLHTRPRQRCVRERQRFRGSAGRVLVIRPMIEQWVYNKSAENELHLQYRCYRQRSCAAGQSAAQHEASRARHSHDRWRRFHGGGGALSLDRRTLLGLIPALDRCCGQRHRLQLQFAVSEGFGRWRWAGMCSSGGS